MRRSCIESEKKENHFIKTPSSIQSGCPSFLDQGNHQFQSNLNYQSATDSHRTIENDHQRRPFQSIFNSIKTEKRNEPKQESFLNNMYLNLIQ